MESLLCGSNFWGWGVPILREEGHHKYRRLVAVKRRVTAVYLLCLIQEKIV